jgi:hypothetical protein
MVYKCDPVHFNAEQGEGGRPGYHYNVILFISVEVYIVIQFISMFNIGLRLHPADFIL